MRQKKISIKVIVFRDTIYGICYNVQRYVELLALTIGKGGATFAHLSAF